MLSTAALFLAGRRKGLQNQLWARGRWSTKGDNTAVKLRVLPVSSPLGSFRDGTLSSGLVCPFSLLIPLRVLVSSE